MADFSTQGDAHTLFDHSLVEEPNYITRKKIIANLSYVIEAIRACQESGWVPVYQPQLYMSPLHY
jgi:hypothetical protein